MFINRSSSSKIIETSTEARSQMVPFQRAIAARKKAVDYGERIPGNSWVELLRAIGDWLLRGDEPHVREMRDRNGQLYFKVYDPLARQNYVFDTDNEVRTWLEKRYNS